MSTAAHPNAGRWRHFKILLATPRTIAFGGSFILIAAIATGVPEGSTLVGLVAAGIALFFVVAWVALLADARAEDDFFRTYAADRALLHSNEQAELPASTGLLRAGTARYSSRSFAGELPGGVDALLSLFTVETETTDGEGNKSVAFHPFTLVLAELPGAADFVGELSCERRSGFRFLDAADDALNKRQRVEVESEALDKRAEIFIGPDDDLGRARQLLSPTFVDWLANCEQDIAIQLEGGMLAVNVKGHLDDAAKLDELCEIAAHVAERVRSEAAESATAEPAEGSFEPAALVPAGDAGGDSEQFVRRAFALTMILAVVIGFGVAALASEDDSSSSDDSDSESFVDDSGNSAAGGGGASAAIPGGSATGQPGVDYRQYDEMVLAAFEPGETKSKTELAEITGLTRLDVGVWFTDAAVRRLVVVDIGNSEYRLTRKGERRRAALIGAP